MRQIFRTTYRADAPWLPREYMLESEAEIAACRTRIVGCSAADLLRVGKSYRLDMKAFSMSAGELIRQDRPAIIWWRYNHWCVMCGRDDQDRVVICNPDRGRYGIDQGSFAALYSGAALFNGEPETLPEISEQ